MMTEWLPRPRMVGGKPLFEALRGRRSVREFENRELVRQQLSDLLWAANGMNRPDGHRTAPSARNWQEIDIYLATKHGTYLYDAEAHALRLVLADDIRAATGLQDFVATAPLNLIYVADISRTDSEDRTERRFYTALDAGFIAQNVYLFCASEGLAAVVRGLLDRKRLATLMRLRPEQRVLVAQSVGYPKA
ncbi:nitroreductase [Hyphomicrobium denitrificans 1NES1]|uniref:Nitroreductase n=2 Tax=Hyphomicrobium denitrificans TaxID=53399 RepID=N0B0C0_9HYPH|nr:nitroreductase [Hyphomicrobium denitrificans 1NES1]